MSSSIKLYLLTYYNLFIYCTAIIKFTLLFGKYSDVVRAFNQIMIMRHFLRPMLYTFLKEFLTMTKWTILRWI